MIVFQIYKLSKWEIKLFKFVSEVILIVILNIVIFKNCVDYYFNLKKRVVNFKCYLIDLHDKHLRP